LQQGRVLVVAKNSSSLPQLWDRFWDGSQWSWSQLGNPLGTSTGPNDQVTEMFPPVVVDGVQNGTYVVTAFVVGQRGTNLNSSNPYNPQFRYELYAREKIGSAAWSDWIQLGNPTQAPFTDPGHVGYSLFFVDQGARWMDGNLLRGSLFGSTKLTPDGNQLIHLFHDNNGWQWDTPVLLPQSQKGGNWITSRVSCAVLTKVPGYPGWHLTALMRSGADTIWNREYDSNTAAWTWRKLQ